MGATVLGALALQPAAAYANCDWYVKTALEQQQRNVKMKCGFSGAEWSVDKDAHAAWCASVGPDVSRAAAKEREAALAPVRAPRASSPEAPILATVLKPRPRCAVGALCVLLRRWRNATPDLIARA